MERAKLELMVGIFVLVGICLPGISFHQAGKAGGHRRTQLSDRGGVYVGPGLKPGASVENCRGRGRPRSAPLASSSDRALVALAIQDGVKLYSGHDCLPSKPAESSVISISRSPWAGRRSIEARRQKFVTLSQGLIWRNWLASMYMAR